MPDLSKGATRQGLSILGSTGSIGTQALEVARLFPDRLSVCALSAQSNVRLLAEQARLYRPDCVVIGDETKEAWLKKELSGTGIRVLAGVDGLVEIATREDVDTVLTAVVGFAGLAPTLAAIRAGKRIALANKETLVVAGELVAAMMAQHGASLIPVDSEHSAIFQCLVGEPLDAVESLI